MTKKTPVLILDIDGVFVTGRSILASPDRDTEMMDPIAVGLLNHVVQNTGARLVLGSSWGRFGLTYEDREHMDRALRSFAAAGLSRSAEWHPQPHIWYDKGVEKVEAVATWLARNSCTYSRWAVLEDMSLEGREDDATRAAMLQALKPGWITMHNALTGLDNEAVSELYSRWNEPMLAQQALAIYL